MPKFKITEKHISDAVKMLLEIDGWRVFHMEPLSNIIQRRYSAELGCPDLLALRYAPKFPHTGSNDILWIEVKRPGAKPKKHQAEWHTAERNRGAEVIVVDDFDKFRAEYISGPLNRSIRA